jgi:hypothetical protein
MACDPAHRNVRRWIVFTIERRGAGVFGVKFGTGFEEADAAVPPEDAVVIAGGADFFGFGEAAQGFFDERKKNVRGAARMELGFGAAFL